MMYKLKTMTTTVFACLFLPLLVNCHQDPTRSEINDKGTKNSLKSVIEQARTVWSYQTLGKRGAFLQQSPESSSTCEADSVEYLMHVYTIAMSSDTSNVPAWVVQLMDTSGKPPNGILQGNINWLGSFTDCLKVEVAKPNSTIQRFTGQYCTAKIKYLGMNFTSGTMPKIFKELGISGEVIQNFGIDLGICWPSSCTQQEVTDQINRILHLNKISKVAVTIEPDSCLVNKPKEFSGNSILAIILFSLFGFLMIAGTSYDLTKSNKDDSETGLLTKFFMAFSVYTNGKKILTTQLGEGSFTCIHGLRFFSISWVILGHSYVNLLLEGPLGNAAALKDAVKNVAFDVVLNSTFSVDTFFVISGFLVTYLFLKEMKKTNGKFGLRRLVQFYVHRYWRLTPAFSMSVLFIGGLLTHVASGPMWDRDTRMEEQNCQKYWWRNMLYIHNMFHIQDMCHDVSWYLGIDMQFYAVSLLILYPLYKMKALGLSIMGTFFVGTAVITGLIIYTNDLPTILYANLGTDIGANVEKQWQFMDMVYIMPYCRMGPYLAGMFLGFIVDRTNLKEKQRFSVIVTGWLLAIVFGFGLVFGNYYCYTGELVMTKAMNTVYGALSRGLWGAVISWIIFACVTGNGGWIDKVLSWNALVPFSRLTYCAYLIHLYILISFYSSQKATLLFDHYFLFLVFFGTLTITMALAFVFSLAFEAPMIELEKLFVQRRSSSTRDDADASPESETLHSAPNAGRDPATSKESLTTAELLENLRGSYESA